MASRQRITVYRYTLPPPYALETAHLFEELPLSSYPSGTAVEPLADEMEPGASLGRATTRTPALVLFPQREPTTRGAGARDHGVLRPQSPTRWPD